MQIKKMFIVSLYVKTLSVILLVTACGSSGDTSSESINAENSSEIEEATSTKVSEDDTSKDSPEISKPSDPGAIARDASTFQERPKLPEPDIELPALSYDKSELPTVTKLEELMEDEARLRAAYLYVNDENDLLKERVAGSLSGTPQEITSMVLAKMDAADRFNFYGRYVAEESMKRFKEKYGSDSEFFDLHRETYYAAEEEVTGAELDGSQIIKDDELRRKVWAEFTNGYHSAGSSNLADMERLLEKSDELIRGIAWNVVSSAEMDIRMAEYSEGKELSDMLNTSISRLKTVMPLVPDNQERLTTLIDEIRGIKKARMAEITKALEETRFPERYSGGNAPSDASDLEERMEEFLSDFNYTDDQKYNVLEIKVAGPWIKIYHSLSGVHMYSQIDFHVAVPSLEDSDIVDILLVTGKTGGPNEGAFGRYSVGSIGQMKKSNL